MTIPEFVREFCLGQQYDSCVNSPCRYAGASGCTHPRHPKNQPAENSQDGDRKGGHDLLD